MNNLGLRKNSLALVVVAHPDDEMIWMGGTILVNPQARWTIVSLCRGSDSDRAPKFRRVCKRLGAQAIIFDMEDEGVMNIRETAAEAERILRRALRGRAFTHIFTHGYNGEYGHPRHKGVHRAVKQMVLASDLSTEHLFYFGYEAADGAFVPRTRKNAAILVRLPETIYAEKRRIINGMYDFQKNSFEYQACLREESFIGNYEL